MIEKKSFYERIEDYEVFKATVHICITECPNQFLDETGLRVWYGGNTPDEDAEKDCGGFVFQRRKDEYYIVLPPEARISSVVHECDHVISRLFADRGIRADYTNDEVHAYYLGELADTVEEFRMEVCKRLKE